MIVYLITNLINGKRYVGQTKQTLSWRWSQHKYLARKGSLLHLSCAIRKHGENNFKIAALCTCRDKAEMDSREREYIVLFETRNKTKGYNLTDGGEGAAGCVRSPEQRLRIKETSSRPENIERLRRLAAAMKGKPAHNKGKPASLEARRNQKLAQARRRKPHCPRGHTRFGLRKAKNRPPYRYCLDCQRDRSTRTNKIYKNRSRVSSSEARVNSPQG